MTKPKFAAAKKPVKVCLHSIMDVLGAVDKIGETEALRKHLAANNATITLPAATINLMKNFVVDRDLHAQNGLLLDVVGSDGSEQNRHIDNCKYKAP